jgi:hypothetical protein
MTYDEILRLAQMAGGTGPEPVAPRGVPPAYGPPAPPQAQALPAPQPVPVPPRAPEMTMADSLGAPGFFERVAGIGEANRLANPIASLIDLAGSLVRGRSGYQELDQRQALSKLQAELDKDSARQAEERRNRVLTQRVGDLQRRIEDATATHDRLNQAINAAGQSEDVAAPLRAQRAAIRSNISRWESALAKLVGTDALEATQAGYADRKLPATQADVIRSESKARAEGSALMGGTKPPDVGDYTSILSRLNTDNDIQKFQVVRDSWATMKSTPESAAGDVSLIYSFMRINDPGSTVREGEYATAQNAAGVSDKIKNAYNRALNGERLTPEQRADFKTTARNIYVSRIPQYERVIGQYRALAKKFGLDENIVLRDYLVPVTFDDGSPGGVTLSDPEKIKEARKRGFKEIY